MKNRDESEPRARGTSRRQFSKAVAAVLVAAPAVAGGAIAAQAQTPTPAPTPAEPKAPPGPPNAAAQQPPSPVAEAYAAVARARFGAQLSVEELARVRRDVEGNVRAAERLRAFKLGNGDEPDFVFSA